MLELAEIFSKKSIYPKNILKEKTIDIPIRIFFKKLKFFGNQKEMIPEIIKTSIKLNKYINFAFR